MKVEVWFVCIAIIMTADSLLDLMFYKIFYTIVFFAKVVIETVFLSCGELSCKMFSIVMFFNQFLEFFLHICNVKTTLSYVKLRLFSVSFEKMFNSLSIAPKTPTQTRNKEWPIALCRYGAPLFLRFSFWDVFMTSAIYIAF